MVARVLLFLKFFHHVADHHHEFVLVRCACIVAPRPPVLCIAAPRALALG